MSKENQESITPVKERALKDQIDLTGSIGETSKLADERFFMTFESNPVPMMLKNLSEPSDMQVNESFLKMIGYQQSDIVDISSILSGIFPSDSERSSFDDKISKEGSVREHPVLISTQSGDILETLVSTKTVMVKNENFAIMLFYDMTERNRTATALKNRETELEISVRRLEELNTALKSLLKHRDQDKREMEERFLSNVKELVLPYIQKLKETELFGLQETFVEIAESNLNDIMSPFLQKITSRYRNFTPKEIQVASLIKEGKRTKEIAQILGISKSAIDLHRNSIRNKLGLINKKTNLRSYLMSLS